MSGVYWGLAVTPGTQGPEGYRGIRALGALRGPFGVSGWHQGV